MTVFKIGDKARIRKDLTGGELYGSCTSDLCYCNQTMADCAGDVVVVSEKDDRTGFMHLRKVEDGFTTEMAYSWSDDMLEPLEEKKRTWPLKVGETVRIRNDISKRVDKNKIIWVTLNGKKYSSYKVSDDVFFNSGAEIIITKAWKDVGHIGNIGYKARLKDTVTEIDCNFDITMFDCFHDWFDDEKSNNGSNGKPNFKVGDKVVIKTTVSSGERIDHITIQPFMFDQAYDKSDPLHPRRRIGTVEWVYGSGTAEGIGTLEISFECDDRQFTWPQKAFELYNESNGKPNPSKKQPPKKKKPDSQDSKVDYSGYTPKSEFYCYDYLNRPATFCKNSMENITKIEITVMSGDETGCFYGVCDGKPWKYGFDTMTTSRFQSYDDGSYTVEGKENIEKWINWSYDPEKAIYAEYSMERMRAFKGC